MAEYEKLAKSYGIKIDIGKGLQIISILTKSKPGIDIGFTTSESNVLGNYFPIFLKHKIYRNISVYGNCSKLLSNILVDDYVAQSNLYIIFDYAYSALWSGTVLEIRVNTLAQGYPFHDGTGGERFLLSVKNLVDRLNAIDPERLDDLANTRRGWGPNKIRKLVLRCAAVFPIVLLLLIRYALLPTLTRPR
jgi:hypothetical protein